MFIHAWIIPDGQLIGAIPRDHARFLLPVSTADGFFGINRMRTRKHLDLNPLGDLARFLAIFVERASIIPQPGTGHGLQGHAADFEG